MHSRKKYMSLFHLYLIYFNRLLTLCKS